MEEDQKRLADALEELKDHNFMKIHESAWKFMYYNLLRGLAIGLGSVVGATVLVTIFIQILAQFEFIPIIGNWAHEVIEIIEKLDKSYTLSLVNFLTDYFYYLIRICKYFLK